MSLAVVDASVLTAFYVADDPRHQAVSTRLGAGDALFAPAHMDAEVVSALRGIARGHSTIRATVPNALEHLARFPIRRIPLAPMLQRIWALEANITPYDAAYVALAERLDGPLITCDGKLAAASGSRCTFELIS